MIIHNFFADVYILLKIYQILPLYFKNPLQNLNRSSSVSAFYS